MCSLRPLAALLPIALLAACGTLPRPDTMPAGQEAADYRAHARHFYAPPGPPGDPWRPYIEAAARRFDVPERWIRAVMRQESGGHEFINGQFVTSAPGAMGLMQLMPPTYDDMRAQYVLGPDPFDPHDNIMAGAAYMRQMYDIYGSPGFLAAYNTGPGRLDDFLTHDRALPHETRQYVAIIGPQIAGSYPASRSEADLMVANHLIQSRTRTVRMAWAHRHWRDPGDGQPVQVAEAPVSAPPVSYRIAWHKLAESAPLSRGRSSGAARKWAIQVGAFGTAHQASRAVSRARSRAGGLSSGAHTEIAGSGVGRAHLYRARLTGLTRDDAIRACRHISREHTVCMVVSPGEQS